MRSSLSFLIILAQVYCPLVQARSIWTFEPKPSIFSALQKKEGQTSELVNRLAGFKKEDEPTFLKNAKELDKQDRSLTRRLAEPVGEVASHGISTVMMIFILTLLESVYENHHISEMKNEPGQPLATLIQNSFIEATNNFQIFLGFSASTVGSAISTPLTNQFYNGFMSLSQSLNIAPIRAAAQFVFVKGGVSLASFLSWELAASFFRMCADMIDNKDDRQAAKNLKFLKIISGQGSSEDNRIFQLVLHNANILLTANPVLLNSWIDNTFRTSIGTGEFVTLIQSMMGASEVLSLFVTPVGVGAGFVFGVVAGVAGGVIQFFIPKNYKDNITWGIQKARLIENNQSMARNDWNIQKIVERSKTVGPLGFNSKTALDFQLQKRRDILDSILTIYSERIYSLYSSRTQNDSVLAVIAQSYGENSTQTQTAKQQNAARRPQFNNYLWQQEKAALNAMAQEEQLLIEILQTSKSDDLNSKIQKHIAENEESKAVMLKLFNSFSFEEMKSEHFENTETFDRKDRETIINSFYMFGFKNKDVRSWVLDSESQITNVTESTDEIFN